MAHQKGLSLMDIPCWWDGNLESLAATVHFQRPDQSLSTSSSIPISLNPPPAFFKANSIPYVGELMLASFPGESQFDSSWWIGEKYDGLRCCWNPEYAKLFARNGRELTIPQKIEDCFPSFYIDGELWFGRGNYQNVFSLINDSPDTPWQFMRCIAFDNPFYQTHKQPFEERAVYKNEREAKKMIDGIINEGGEGLMLRKRRSPYEQGRSLSLFKLKTTQADKEGIITKVLDDRSIIIKLPTGQLMTVPSKDVEEGVEKEMKAGDIVSFSYEASSRRDVPSGIKVFRIRLDLSWEDVIINHSRDSVGSSAGEYKSQPHKHWSTKNMKVFFENFVRNLGLDPSLASTWYQADVLTSINKSKKGRAILQKFKGGYIKAVQKLFTEITFDPTQFQKAYWVDIRARRNFFENYAKAHSFDHQHAPSWYSQSIEDILATKGASRVLTYHENSVAKALIDLFPNIGLDKSQFESSQSLFQYASNRRKFFEKVAKENGFDPLISSNWYSFPKSGLLSSPGARSVLVYYRDNIAKALNDLFPGLGLEESKFKFYWRDSNNRRRFFEHYAKSNQFDPLVPSNWYSHPLEQIKAQTDATSVLYYYGDSVIKALLELFPGIGLNKYKLMAQYVKLDVNSLKQFFEEFATRNQFDPYIPENWYRVEIQNFPKKVSLIIKVYFNNDVPQAVAAAFPKIGLDTKQFAKSKKDVEKESKKFFESYAKAFHFDPRDPANWYKQPVNRIMEYKGATKVMAYHSSSVTKALLSVFPDIGLDSSQFYGSWKSDASRRKFFENFAKANGFDPLVPRNWYSQSRLVIYSFMGGERVLSYHNRSVSQALIDLFPEIGLDITEFKNSHSYWRHPENRKRFFEEFAEVHNFDPLDVNQWYSQRASHFKESKAASHVLRHHNDNVGRALVDLFPELKFDHSKFKYKGMKPN